MRLVLELLLFAHVWMAALVIPVGLWHLARDPEKWVLVDVLFPPAPRRRRRRRRNVRRPTPSSYLPMSGALVPGVGSALAGVVGGAVAVFLNSQLGGHK